MVNVLSAPALIGSTIVLTLTFTAAPTSLIIYIRRHPDTKETFEGTPTGNGWSLVSGNTYTFTYVTTKEGRHNFRIEATDGTELEIVQMYFQVLKNNTN